MQSCCGTRCCMSLRGDNDVEAFGAFSHETVETAIAEFSPNLVVIDSSHPDGKALVAAVRTRLPKVGVIVLAMRERDEEFLAWADIGISGYLGPDTSASGLMSLVRRAAAGDVVCPPRLTALLMNRFAGRSVDRTSRASIHALTAREREIAALLADGMSNKLIARRLGVALATVKNHVHSILEKWDVRSRGEAAARFRRPEHEVSWAAVRWTADGPCFPKRECGIAERRDAKRHDVVRSAGRVALCPIKLLSRSAQRCLRLQSA